MGTCRHYNGTVGGTNACCEAGVNYRALVGGPDLGWLARLPCVPRSRTDAGDVVHCALFAPKTREEIAAERAEMRAALDRMGRLDPLFGKIKADHHGRDASGTMDCPECGAAGALRWSHAAYNGHVRLHCSTPDCLSIME
jgi:hypothetical protein